MQFLLRNDCCKMSCFIYNRATIVRNLAGEFWYGVLKHRKIIIKRMVCI